MSITFALLASLLLSITIKPWFTSFAMVSVGIFKTFLTNTSLAVTCIWISDVDIAVAVTGFAKVTYKDSIVLNIKVNHFHELSLFYLHTNDIKLSKVSCSTAFAKIADVIGFAFTLVLRTSRQEGVTRNSKAKSIESNHEDRISKRQLSLKFEVTYLFSADGQGQG